MMAWLRQEHFAMANEVGFKVVERLLADEPARVVWIWVDGVPLEEWARRVELPFAEAEGKPDLAGGYEGLSARMDILWPSRHFLGEPRYSWFDDGDTVLLGCTCGDWGCWPLVADVVESEDSVSWSRFRNGHRANWDLEAVGPFIFERPQYEAALRQAE
ncbi:hypothetical protein O1R50_22665 [Glycomyces luteolus]|uniref:Uncharacterized protein n=1 Tax=Glycomyces luteolus TaxID=2670330 RepID=A0A9X3PFC1_9ACTN|nr:hypothetical protein [Glycomyces luteolus]MDA1362445.1 hypothetical protein [Glycomyces luteolus]